VLVRRDPKDESTLEFLVVYGESHYKSKGAAELDTALIERFGVIGLEGGFAEQIQNAPGGKIFWMILRTPVILVARLFSDSMEYSAIGKALNRGGGAKDHRENHGPADTFFLEENYELDSGFKAGILYLELLLLRAALAAGVGSTKLFKKYIWPRKPKAPDDCTGALCQIRRAIKKIDKAVSIHFLATALPAYFLKQYWWSWLINPVVALAPGSYSTVIARNEGMANAMNDIYEIHPNENKMLVIMGWGHQKGFIENMVRDHGFEIVPMRKP